MKLKAELNTVTKAFQNIKQLIPGHVELVKQEGNCKDLETRIAWDCLRSTMGTDWICNIYGRYDCSDKHITTLAKAALRAVYTTGEEVKDEQKEAATLR